MFLSFFKKLAKPIFGNFETEEFKKFLRMGALFAFIIGVYWTLSQLKTAIFCSLIGASQIPWAKTISFICLIPVVLLYTKLLEKFAREKVFYLLAVIYGACSVFFGILLLTGHIAQAECLLNGSETTFSNLGSTFLVYVFYIFSESFGALFPALFWAIAADTTQPESAKKGFSLIVAIGQLGGIAGPYFISSLPLRLGFETSALSLFICAAAIFYLIFLLKRFFIFTPADLLVSFHGKNESSEEKKQEMGFFEGLYLLLSHSYLLGIFAVIAFPDFLSTIFDVHFNSLAAQHYSGVELAEFLGIYGSSVNLIALIFLLCGIGNIARFFGVAIALLLMPVIYAAATLGFVTLNSLTFLFALMASSKAINYSLNSPAVKQLYIPTTHDVRFKSQAWIDAFGSRGAKQSGSLFNMMLTPMQKNLGEVAGRARHALWASYLGFGIIGCWFFIAFYLGRMHKKAIDEKRVVC
ncbi:hypothetical protein HYX58_01480 [Candidatus Dependentiae bacterium]|nr:hypothetical protein [Candidatus Dependentiae bacterium]